MSKDFIAHYDTLMHFTNQKCFIVTGTHLEYLTLFLNSSVNNFYFKTCLGATLGAGGYEMSKIFVDHIPAPEPADVKNKEARKIIRSPQNKQPSTEMTNNFIYEAYDFTGEEIKIIEAGAQLFESGY